MPEALRNRLDERKPESLISNGCISVEGVRARPEWEKSAENMAFLSSLHLFLEKLKALWGGSIEALVFPYLNSAATLICLRCFSEWPSRDGGRAKLSATGAISRVAVNCPAPGTQE